MNYNRASILALLIVVSLAFSIDYHLKLRDNYLNGTYLAKVIDKAQHASVIVELVTKDPEHMNAARATGLVGHGTGFFYKFVNDDAFIVTNYHVIENATKLPEQLKLVVTTASRPWTYDAELIGFDKVTDIAVLKIQRKDDELAWNILPWAEDTDRLPEALPVISIGHGLGQYWSATTGKINATQRFAISPFNFLIQHDSVINMGNSGGPLLNYHGEVIGVNQLLLSPVGTEKAKGFDGVAFAVVGWQAKRSVESILEKGFVLYPQYKFSVSFPKIEEMPAMDKAFGGTRLNQEKRRTYAKVEQVDKDPHALKAGIENGDYITAVNGKAVWSMLGLIHEVLKYDPGDIIEIELLRDGEFHLVEYKLSRMDVPDLTPQVVPPPK